MKAVFVLLAIAFPLVAAEPQAIGTWTSGEYRYDGAGNIVSIGTAGMPGTHGAKTYGYDAVSRLTRAQLGTTAGTREYSYDPFGNRAAYGVDQQWVSVPVDGATNRLTDATYDAAGNQLTRGATAATFDGFGMVTAYRFDAVSAEAYVYTASDERIGALRGNEWTWSFRDASGRLLRQYRSSATDPNAQWLWAEDFVYRGTLLLGSERAAADGGRRHYHLDHLGSPRVVTSAAGSVISEHEFLPFGEERTAVGQQRAKGFDRETPHRFTGHERDFDTAAPNDSSGYVDYLHARYYAARTGRFLSVDPAWESADLGTPQTWNRYAYVRNNPVNRIDPDGRLDGNGMGEPLERICSGCSRQEQLEQSNRIARRTAAAGAVALSVLVPDPSDLLVGTAAGALARRFVARFFGRAAVTAGDEIADTVKVVEVSQSKYGEAVEHIRDAQAAGQPRVLTIDRGAAKARRAEAMQGHPTVPGKDRDEYPPAMFKEGGQGSSVRPIDPSANRGCGASVGNQCRNLTDGTKVEIVPKP